MMILDIVNNLLLHVEVKKKVSTRGGPGFLERGVGVAPVCDDSRHCK